jgi:transcription elongation GreA/GreB family factor
MSRAFTKERDDAPEPPILVRPRYIEKGAMEPPTDRRLVGFGATVVVEGTGPSARTFRIAGPDATDLAAGRLGLDSPLATALLGARAGATVTWHRPVGDARVKIVSVKYDDTTK